MATAANKCVWMGKFQRKYNGRFIIFINGIMGPGHIGDLVRVADGSPYNQRKYILMGQVGEGINCFWECIPVEDAPVEEASNENKKDFKSKLPTVPVYSGRRTRSDPWSGRFIKVKKDGIFLINVYSIGMDRERGGWVRVGAGNTKKCRYIGKLFRMIKIDHDTVWICILEDSAKTKHSIPEYKGEKESRGMYEPWSGFSIVDNNDGTFKIDVSGVGVEEKGAIVRIHESVPNPNYRGRMFYMVHLEFDDGFWICVPVEEEDEEENEYEEEDEEEKSTKTEARSPVSDKYKFEYKTGKVRRPIYGITHKHPTQTVRLALDQSDAMHLSLIHISEPTRPY